MLVFPDYLFTKFQHDAGIIHPCIILKLFQHNNLTPRHISSARFHQREIRHHYSSEPYAICSQHYSDLCTPILLSHLIISDQLQKFFCYYAPSLLHAQQLPGVLDPVLTENQESGKRDTMACHFKELVFS